MSTSPVLGAPKNGPCGLETARFTNIVRLNSDGYQAPVPEVRTQHIQLDPSDQPVVALYGVRWWERRQVGPCRKSMAPHVVGNGVVSVKRQAVQVCCVMAGLPGDVWCSNHQPPLEVMMKTISIDVSSFSKADKSRFESKCERQPSGCLKWVGASTPAGYGRFRLEGRLLLAHRVSFAIANGAIPATGVIDHICNTPWCVEPTHLRHTSYAFNTARGGSPVAVNIRRVQETGACIRGHELSGSNLGVSKSGRYCRLCRRENENARRSGPDVRRRRAIQAREYRLRAKSA